MAEVTEHLDEFSAGAQLNALLAEAAPVEAEKPAKPLPPRAEDGKFTKAEPEEEAAPEVEPEPEPEVEEEEKPEVRLVKVKVDGMEVEVDEEELKKGYSRTSDYTKKTQAIAEERRKVEAEAASVRQERQEYAERLEKVHAALEALTPSTEPDWMQAQKDGMTPEAFTAHYAAWKANRDRMQKIEAEHARIAALQQQDSEKVRMARLAEQKAKLEAAIPELQDPEKGKVLRQDLMDYAKSVGFTDDDLASVEDHRPLVLLHKARMWDEYQKSRPKVEAKVDHAISSMKPSGAKPAPKAKVVDGLRTQLTTSGSVEAAAKYLDTIGFK